MVLVHTQTHKHRLILYDYTCFEVHAKHSTTYAVYRTNVSSTFEISATACSSGIIPSKNLGNGNSFAYHLRNYKTLPVGCWQRIDWWWINATYLSHNCSVCHACMQVHFIKSSIPSLSLTKTFKMSMLMIVMLTDAG